MYRGTIYGGNSFCEACVRTSNTAVEGPAVLLVLTQILQAVRKCPATHSTSAREVLLFLTGAELCPLLRPTDLSGAYHLRKRSTRLPRLVVLCDSACRRAAVPGLAGAFFCDRDGENADFVVVRQSERPCAFGHRDRVREEVRVLIRLVEPIGSVMMGCVPGKTGGLNVARLETHVVLGIARRWDSCSRCCSSAGGHGA